MLTTRIKRRADHNKRARKQIMELEASIAGLDDEDLLDLADIFENEPRTCLAKIALDEMARRNISL